MLGVLFKKLLGCPLEYDRDEPPEGVIGGNEAVIPDVGEAGVTPDEAADGDEFGA